MGVEPTPERPIVWSGGGAVADRCPVSQMGGEQAAWLKLFAMLSSGVVHVSTGWWAKDLDAMTVLANESRRTEDSA